MIAPVEAKEYARIHRLDVKTVYRGCKLNQLSHVRVGRRILIYPTAEPPPPSAAAPTLSALRRERVGLLAEFLGRRPGGRLALDAAGYLAAEAAGLPIAALDQAIEDAPEKVSVSRASGGPITVTLTSAAPGEC